MSRFGTYPDQDHPLNEDRSCEDMRAQQEGRMRNLSWRVKLNQTKDSLIVLSTLPKFRSMDLASIHPIIEVLDQGSYRFESLFVMNADGWFVEGSTDGLEEA